MSAEHIAAVVNLGISADVRVPATHTPGDTTQRTIRNLGGDLLTNESHAMTDASEAPLAVIRQTLTIPATPFTYTLDLSAAPIEGAVSGGARALTEDLDGRKLIGMQFQTSGNTGTITVKAGASNGYNLFGSSGLVVMQTTDDFARWVGADSLPDVDNATAYNIDFVGTTQNDTIDVMLLFSA